MSRTVITVEDLGKEYVIGGRGSGRETFREMVVSAAASPFRRLKRLSGNVSSEERIWALKDVSFDVKEGEVVGIIGRNGAGKSTLLKILSRITAPTEGRAEIRGRVSSLLEVGTGFHPELTGRENIYLNGAILGMSRAEIDRKFDEIVDFSGVEKFLDTPVKRYSSGMSVRLAFAVAAHLEPEILIVDEVLAVGDAEFQKKCLGKMQDVAGGGRTVLFVSHNMAAVDNLCTKGVLLKQGTVAETGTIGDVIASYSRSSMSENQIDVTNHPCRVPGFESVFRQFEISDALGKPTGHVGMGDAISFRLELQLQAHHRNVVVALHFYNWMGQRVATAHTSYQTVLRLGNEASSVLVYELDHLDLMPGQYRVVAAAAGMDQIDRIDPVAVLEVLPRDVFGTGLIPPTRDGVFFLRGRWGKVA